MMTFESTRRRAGILLALAAISALSFAFGLAEAQEGHPAFGRQQFSRLTVEAEVWPADATAEQIAAAVKKLEAAAVTAIRRNSKPLVDGKKFTVAEAQALLRVQVGTDAAGKPIYKTDVQRCLEWIIPDVLATKITSAKVTGTSIEAEHPVAVQP